MKDKINRLCLEYTDGHCGNLPIAIMEAFDQEMQRVVDEYEDKLADYDNAILKKFDSRASKSTDLYTWIKCKLTKVKQLEEELAQEKEFRIHDGMNNVFKDEALYLNRAKRAEKKVKQLEQQIKKYGKGCPCLGYVKLEQQIKDLEEEVRKGQIQFIRAETLEQQLKESREVSAEDIKTVIEKANYQKNRPANGYLHDSFCLEVATAIYNLIYGDKPSDSKEVSGIVDINAPNKSVVNVWYPHGFEKEVKDIYGVDSFINIKSDCIVFDKGDAKKNMVRVEVELTDSNLINGEQGE